MTTQNEGPTVQNRREFLKGSGIVAGGFAVAGEPGAQAGQQDPAPPSQNPYGARPGGGISLPEYYQPWPAIKNRNMYLPRHRDPAEERDAGLVHGQHAVPGIPGAVGHVHAGRAGQRYGPQPRRFFFDMGGGSIRNVIAMQVPMALVNDLFISHLHVDHYADLPIMYAFRAYQGRIHAAQGIRAVGTDTRAWHQAHDQAPEGDDPLAHGELQQRPHRRRL